MTGGMTHCAKCGAELIGSKKFCAACGTPASDPRSPAASTGATPVASAVPSGAGSAPGSGPSHGTYGPSSPSLQYVPAPPISQVNPFAQTAGPGSARLPSTDYGPPPASVPPELASTTPGVGDPRVGPHVSPLASSNVNSERGAFHTAGADAVAAAAAQAIERADAKNPPSTAPAAPVASAPGADSGATKRGVPGTQMMPSMQVPRPSPASSASAASAPPRPAPRQDRTQLIAAIPSAKSPAVAAASAAPAAPAPAAPQPPPPAMPPSPAIPQHHPYAATPYAHAPIPPHPHPQAPAPPPPGAYAYGFGYAPGARVVVTWSNGQRYPGTVQQVSGAQCLVVFPDGQQHWIEMQYVAPG